MESLLINRCQRGHEESIDKQVSDGACGVVLVSEGS